MIKKSMNPNRVAGGNAEQATVEALSDNQLVTAGSSNQMKGNFKQVAEGVEDALEE